MCPFWKNKEHVALPRETVCVSLLFVLKQLTRLTLSFYFFSWEKKITQVYVL